VNHSRLALTSLVLAAWATFGGEHVAAQNGNSGLTEQIIDLTLEAGQACTFAVRLSGQGKTKTIAIAGGRSIITSPGLKVTVTNLADPTSTKEVTLNVTGSSHVTTDANGVSTYVVTGRNLNLDPNAGFVLSSGRFTFAVDRSGNLVQPLSGNGQLTNVCSLIE
jgi:hypothetical protein